MSVNWASTILLLLFTLAATAQTTGSLTVRLLASDGSAVDHASVRLENRTTGFARELVAQPAGAYTLADIPLAAYVLVAEAPGFGRETRTVAVRSNVPLTLDLALSVATVEQSVTVGVSGTSDLVDPEATGTRTALTASAMEKIPTPAGTRGLEAYLLTFPGFAMNANGAIHPRGAHNQMTYVIDGLPISDQLTGAFATALDPSMVASLELYTGDVPAEFGAKVSGVAVVSTRSGAGSGRRQFGEAELDSGSFHLRQAAVREGGEVGRLAWFALASGVATKRFLDQVSLDNLHNGGNAERAYLRLDYQLSDRDTVRFNGMLGRSSFELANLRSQQANAMDQRQLMRDASFWIRWNRVLGPASTWESTLAWRPTIAQLLPSPGDTPVSASQARHLATVVFANRYNRIFGAHQLRAGADFQRFHVSENFTMAITGADWNVPGSPKFNEELAPYDLTRGGTHFRFADRHSGTLASAFLQDSIRWRRFVLSLGARYDDYRFLTHGHQFQPRVGLAFHLRETGTVFRASYNRNYQTPPNENLLLSASPQAAQLARAVLAPLRPQRENVTEAGLQQLLFGRATLNASYYHKDSRDQQDNNNFFDTGLIFPVTLAQIRVNGAEGRITLPTVGRLTATLSATHSHAVTTPPFTGGLFVGQDAINLLKGGPFVIDHDQKLSLQVTAHYTLNRSWWASSAVRYDSGLVANPADPVAISRSGDYRDLLPYVDLLGNPPRVRPRTITDMSLGYQRMRGERRLWDLQLNAGNLFDINALYNFQSVFVGTRVVSPRSAALKLRLYW